MANQIQFWNLNDEAIDSSPTTLGKIYLTQRVENDKYYANLYVDLKDSSGALHRYLLKPPYNLDDLISGTGFESEVINEIYKRLDSLEIFAGHFKVVREWKTDQEEETLHIYSAQDPDTGDMEDDTGIPVTRARLKELIQSGEAVEDPGFFTVDGEKRYISGVEELVGYFTLTEAESDEND